jgi:hypothetical protein
MIPVIHSVDVWVEIFLFFFLSRKTRLYNMLQAIRNQKKKEKEKCNFVFHALYCHEVHNKFGLFTHN